MRRSSSAGSSRPRNSCWSISAKAARSFGAISRMISSTMLALEDDALLVCHLIADFRSHIELMLSRTRVGITPRRGSGMFRAKNKSRMLGTKLQALALSAGGDGGRRYYFRPCVTVAEELVEWRRRRALHGELLPPAS